MNRRQMITTTGLGAAGFIVGTGFSAPACGVSKDKAVKYAGLAIGFLRDAAPIFASLGTTEIANLVLDKAVPALEKLKSALESADIPMAGSTLETIQNVLGQVATALLRLPDSTRKNTILGILGLVNLTLRTVSTFVEMDIPPTAMAQAPRKAVEMMQRAASPNEMKAIFQATRF